MNTQTLLNPFAIVSVLLCLCAITQCAVLMTRLPEGKDRFLVGLMGMLSVQHGVRIIGEVGVLFDWHQPGSDPITNLLIPGLYLSVILLLNRYTAEHRRVRYQLRLSEAREALPATPFVPAPGDQLRAQEISNAVLESLPLPAYALDPSGSVCYWNSAAERLFGWTRSEVLGRKVSDLGLDAGVAAGGSADSARTLCTKHGTHLRADVWLAPIRSATASLRGTLTIVAGHHADTAA
jgi:PAS domain-containing protein